MFLVEYRALLRRLNGTCTRALEAAVGLAVSRSDYEVATPHLLLKLLEEIGSDVPHIFRALNVSQTPLVRALQRSLETRRAGNSGKPVLSPLLVAWLQDAWLLGSVEAGVTRVRSGHLLAVLLMYPERYEAADHAELLQTLDAEAVRRRLDQLTQGSTEVPLSAPPEAAGESARAAGVAGIAQPAREDSALGRYTTDLTARARQGHIDPVLGRDREIRQLIDILSRQKKNNPIIVGEAGVGKTALVEGLALHIAAGEVPKALLDVQIRSLDLGLLQSGAGVKGEFEARLTAVMGEVKASPRPIILFIDEAHTLIGAGNLAGGTDAANLLKPALARGELRTIAATTWSEYKKYFEKDAALSRRFHPVRVEEPAKAVAIDMLRGLAARLSRSHGVHIRDDAVVAAVELSSRYISGRLLPDKAVDLLDTCAARVKVAQGSKPKELEGASRRVESLERERTARREDLRLAGDKAQGDTTLLTLDAALREAEGLRDALDQRFEKERQAAEAVLLIWREQAVAKSGSVQAEDHAPLKQALARLSESRKEVPLMPVEVDPDLVSAVVADWTGIPVGKMVRDDLSAVSAIEERLSARIRGQDAAVQAIARRLRNARAGLQDPRQPLGIFLLVGPSGTGKTETGLSVADLLFGGERFVIAINMSEFQEKFTVTRLIGSPPGYVGYGEGGVLTEAVRQRPYSVVLLDEVEKADPEVMNLFYQVFDKGTLADGESRVVDFRNTVIFLTSNLGSELTMRLAAEGGKRPSLDELGKALRPVLNQHFKPALLARMTVVPFFPIGPEVLRQIVDQKLAQVAARLKDSHGVTLSFDDPVGDAIVSRCTEVETGARNVDHIVREHLLPMLATEVLQRLAAEDMPDALRVGLTSDGEFRIAEPITAPAGGAS